MLRAFGENKEWKKISNIWANLRIFEKCWLYCVWHLKMIEWWKQMVKNRLKKSRECVPLPFLPTKLHDRFSWKEWYIMQNLNFICLSLIAASSYTQVLIFTKKLPPWHLQKDWQSSENQASEQEGVPVFNIFLSSQSVKFFN